MAIENQSSNFNAKFMESTCKNQQYSNAESSMGLKDGKSFVDDNLIRNVMNEVLRECKNRRLPAVPDCVNYFSRLLALDPNRGLSEDYLNAREQINNFVNLMLHWMANQKSPKIICVKLQHRFQMAYKKIELEVKNYRLSLENKLYPLMMSIVEPDHELPTDELYKRLAYYTTLISGMGNPTEKPVYKESLQVLKSVFEKREIRIFPKLINFVRRDIVENLVELTTGIKVYNTSCNKAGEGVSDLPTLLKQGISAMVARTEKTKTTMEARVNTLTKIFEKNMVLKKVRHDIVVEFSNLNSLLQDVSPDILKENTTQMKSSFKQNTPTLRSPKISEKKISSQRTNVPWEYLVNTTLAYRQTVENLRVFLMYLADMEQDRAYVCDEMKKTIEHLKDVIIPNLHQAASLTFPHFQKLSEIWRHLQDEAVRLNEIDNIVDTQAALVHSLHYDLNLIKNLELADNRSLSIEDEKLVVDYSNVKLVNYDPAMTLEFKGFCCYIMVMTNGILIPGKVEIGVIQYNNKYYTFSSNLAANYFAKNPEEYIGKVLQLCRQEFQLIHFLQVHEKLEEVIKIKNLYEPKIQIRHDMVDMGQQTELHPVKSNVNLEYRWNLWDYKRQVLKMADTVQMQTKATATSGLKSQFKNNQGTQTQVPKVKSTQTIKESYAKTDRMLSHLMGLRGRRDQKFEQIKIWLKD